MTSVTGDEQSTVAIEHLLKDSTLAIEHLLKDSTLGIEHLLKDSTLAIEPVPTLYSIQQSTLSIQHLLNVKGAFVPIGPREMRIIIIKYTTHMYVMYGIQLKGPSKVAT